MANKTATASKKGPGVLIRTLRKGDGVRIPKKGDLCMVHFEGFLEDGKTKVVSTRDKQQEFQFELGAGHVVQGLEVAVERMSVGTMAEVTIPSLYAYGQQGMPPKIPPRATLIFSLELLDIEQADGTAANS